jgi:phage terminase large subunit-like protein
MSKQHVATGVVHAVPPDMRKALTANKDVLEAWNDLTPLARRGKLLRAEPIAGLYERNLVRHFGILPKAESQMCNFNQHQNKKELCDTVDSTVYALQALLDRTERYYTNGAFYAVGGPRETVMTFKVM